MPLQEGTLSMQDELTAMLIEFVTNPKDVHLMYAELARATAKSRKMKIRIAILLLCAGVIGYSIYAGIIEKPVNYFCILTAAFLFLSTETYNYLRRRTIVCKRASKASSGLHCSVRISPDHIEYSSDKISGSMAWRHASSVLQTSSYFFVLLYKESIPIPLSAFDNLDHAAEFKRLATSYIAERSKNAHNLPSSSIFALLPEQWPPAPKNPPMNRIIF
jgi:hypothetical protein